MKIRLLTAAALLLAASTAPAIAQEKKPEAGGMDPKMMEAMMKAATPGEHHKHLDHLVGDWTYTLKLWMDPAQAPVESLGTMHAEWVLDGRYVQSVWKGDMMGMAFEGRGTDGYDNVAGKYFSSWIDNAGTGILLQTGDCDHAKKTCTLVGDTSDPMTGKKITAKSVSSSPDKDNFKMEMYMKDGSGSELKSMEIVAKRKK